MKISIGTNIMGSSWGGGNKFALSLFDYLKNRGWEVITDLKDKGIDIILMTEPRKNSQTCSYNQVQISRYLIRKPDTVVIHRINECDERKKTKYMNEYLVRANKVADHTIFISNFLEDLFMSKGFFHNENHSVIRNGADNKVFNKRGKKKWNGKSPIKVVTHHWSTNYNKGFDIYRKLDSIKNINGKKVEFCYIGRLPDNIKFKNCKVIAPLDGKELARELKSNHIYITGSINEPAGMHHIEGAMCGLPLLFRNSGALPEYCKDFGVMFDGPEDLRNKFAELLENYEYYFDRIGNYPYDASLMCEKYEKIFLELLKKRKFNLTKRRLKYMIIFIKEIGFSVKNRFLSKFKKILNRYFGYQLKINYNWII